MNPIKSLFLIYFASLFLSQLNAQGIVTNYYSISNNKYFVLPINATNDSTVAKRMFENFSNASGIRFEPQSFICNNTFIPAPFYIIDKPNVLSSNSLKKSGVKIFSEKNYNGNVATINVGTSLPCMDADNPSFDEKSEDIVSKVGNDQISSILVPKGLKITVWEHCPYEGKSKVFTSNTKDLEDYDDIISSIKVELIDSLFSEDGSYTEVTKENYATKFPFAQPLSSFPLDNKKINFAMSSIGAIQQDNKTMPDVWTLQSMFGTNTYCIVNQKTGDYLRLVITKSFSIAVTPEKTKDGLNALDKSYLWFLHYDALTKTHTLTSMLTGTNSNLSFDVINHSFYLGQSPLDIKNARWILTPRKP
jgi:hypothetical protein